MRFLSKAELRYLIKHEKRISERLKNNLIDYCSVNRINLDKWSISNEEWNNDQDRIKVEKTQNTILVKKLESAKKADIRSEIFIIIMIAILLIGTVYMLITKGIEGYESIMGLVFIPVLSLMIVELSKRLKQRKLESLEDRAIQIDDKSLIFMKDGEEIIHGKISQVRFYWREGTEAGENPKITLDIKLGDGKNIRLDEEGNYKELLVFADKIAQDMEHELIFINKNAPESYFARL